jgi:hypothetical protein
LETEFGDAGVMSVIWSIPAAIQWPLSLSRNAINSRKRLTTC